MCVCADASAAMVAPGGGADPEASTALAVVASQPGTKQEVWEGGQLVAAGAIAPTGASGYPIAGPAQGPLGQYPQYPVTLPSLCVPDCCTDSFNIWP